MKFGPDCQRGSGNIAFLTGGQRRLGEVRTNRTSSNLDDSETSLRPIAKGTR